MISKQRRNTEHTVSIKAAVRAQNMEVRMPSQKITERVNGDDRPRNRVLFRYGFLEEFPQSFPGTTGEIGKQLSIVEEIPAKYFRYAEYEMTVWNILQDFFAPSVPM